MFFACVIYFGCNSIPYTTVSINEIKSTEVAFVASADKNGLAFAFAEFAAKDAEINWEELIRGRDLIRFYITNRSNNQVYNLNGNPIRL